MKNLKNYFTKTELLIWGLSVTIVLFSFFLLDGKNYLSLSASLIGVTSLVLNAKGNPVGQALTVIFSVIYGIISYSYSYYGEMITYLGMTAPMAVFSLVAWIRHPFKGKKAEVEVNELTAKEYFLAAVLAIVITILSYFALEHFETTNLLISTISVTTSFAAVYLTFRRSPYYAIAYAANDIVLIILWILASIENPTYVSVVVCFVAFFANDVYGFINWRAISKRQKAAMQSDTES